MVATNYEANIVKKMHNNNKYVQLSAQDSKKACFFFINRFLRAVFC